MSQTHDLLPVPSPSSSLWLCPGEASASQRSTSPVEILHIHKENLGDDTDRPGKAGGSKFPEHSHTHLSQCVVCSHTFCCDTWGQVRRRHPSVFTNHPQCQRWYLSLLGKVNLLLPGFLSPRRTIIIMEHTAQALKHHNCEVLRRYLFRDAKRHKTGTGLPAFFLPF